MRTGPVCIHSAILNDIASGRVRVGKIDPDRDADDGALPRSELLHRGCAFTGKYDYEYMMIWNSFGVFISMMNNIFHFCRKEDSS